MTVVTIAQTSDRSTPASRRLLYVDNLRWVLISLVVAGHLAMTYGFVGEWYYSEPGETSDIFMIVLLPLAAIGYASLLGLFSLIAGYFTAPAYDRKGPAPFLGDRVKRLLLPLFIYEFLLNVIIGFVRDSHEGTFQGSLGSYFGLYFSPLKSIGDGPVWYLLMLFVFSLAYAVWRILAASLRHGQGTGVRAPRPVPGNGTIAVFATALGLATFVVRIWAPTGEWYEPWHQEYAHYPQYVAMFVVGILAYRSDWLSRFPDAQARLWRWLIPAIVVALAGVAGAAGAFGGALNPEAAGGLNWLSLAYAMWEGWTCVAVVIVMLTWFRKRFDRQNRLTRELADDAFGVYVFHPIIIVPLAIALSGITMNLGLKFLWVTPLALAICYGVVAVLRRLPGLRRIL